MNNIKEIRKALNLTQIQFAKELGLEQGSYSYLESKAKTVSKSIQIVLKEKFNINIEYLLTGNGNMFSTEGGSANRVIKKPLAIPSDPTKDDSIPLLEASIEAGVLRGFSDSQIKNQLPHYTVPGFKGADFLATVSGDSMTDRYWPGDVVGCKIITSSGFIQWGKVHVLDTTQGGLLKRIMPSDQDGFIKALSFNSDNYPPFDVPKSEIIGMAIVMGVVRLV